jgi:hypothetical protein
VPYPDFSCHNFWLVHKFRLPLGLFDHKNYLQPSPPARIPQRRVPGRSEQNHHSRRDSYYSPLGGLVFVIFDAHDILIKKG